MDEGVEARWARWLAPHGDAPPLDEAAARIASEEGGDGTGVSAALDALAAGVGTARDPVEQLARLVQHLFGEIGFRGDDEEYDHPRNSCIDQVLERRRGLPILLSTITMEVGRRIGLPLYGIGYPGHFLVGTTTSPVLYLDPFDGGRLRRTTELVADLGRRLGRDPEPLRHRRLSRADLAPRHAGPDVDEPVPELDSTGIVRGTRCGTPIGGWRCVPRSPSSGGTGGRCGPSSAPTRKPSRISAPISANGPTPTTRPASGGSSRCC